MKHAWIQEHQDSYPVQTMCCLLGVSRSGFYKWLDATPSPRAIRSETIKATVRRVFEASRGIYGSKKIAHELQKSTEVEKACRNTVAKAMKKMGLKSRIYRRFRPTTTVADPSKQPAANLLNQEFQAARPNQRWVADITYLPTSSRWVYGQDGDKYTGFHVGEGNVQFDDTLLLIEPNAASEYAAPLQRAKEAEDATRKAAEGAATNGSSSGDSTISGTTSQTTGGTVTGGGTGPVGPGPTPPSKPKSFHGSIQIKPSTAKMHLVQVAEEIISILAGDPNANLEITLEINAEFPFGASDQIKRAV